ncbi:Lrp/AsnC family transcriptional regulator [Halococcoides cellulosivorans]|uniref:siroheme decarboxylase n=2 Tax=Halococcoides cellulosivorans TaxID=1679096 RepID=A0A2R4X0J3_9EURY|nr:Lrp/AsnC family transcriptional regulator [Halococcoides cellulosivorans]
MQNAGWQAGLGRVERAILEQYQSGWPVVERPFEAIGAAVDAPEPAVSAAVEGLLDRSLVRRVGPVFDPPRIGSSTLAAVRAPPDRVDAVAQTIDAHDRVTHDYERDSEWTLWFVVTAGSRDRRDAVLADIERETGLEPLVLPMQTAYYVDLEFPVLGSDPLATGERTTVDPTPIDAHAADDLTPLDEQIILASQDGLPLSTTPYRDLAETIDADPDRVRARLDWMLDRGYVKRIGAVVDHRATGFTANCMVVWDVPAAALDDVGTTFGADPAVTLCYHRPQRPARDWPYSLFTMIHGRDRAAVDAKIDALDASVPYGHQRLYTTAVHKQTGARYEGLLD